MAVERYRYRGLDNLGRDIRGIAGQAQSFFDRVYAEYGDSLDDYNRRVIGDPDAIYAADSLFPRLPDARGLRGVEGGALYPPGPYSPASRSGWRQAAQFFLEGSPQQSPVRSPQEPVGLLPAPSEGKRPAFRAINWGSLPPVQRSSYARYRARRRNRGLDYRRKPCLVIILVTVAGRYPSPFATAHLRFRSSCCSSTS